MNKYQFAILASISLSSAYPSMALPVLDESASTSGKIITLFPDHNDKTKVYFFPNQIVPERDSSGTPRFSFTYNVGKEHSAALSARFRQTLTQDMQDELQSQVSQGRQVIVLPVIKSYLSLFDVRRGDGTVGIDEGLTSYKLPPFAGRAEDSIGISVRYNAIGGSYMLGGIQANSGDTFYYCYQVKGLTPPMRASVTVDYKKTYDYFKSSLKGSVLTFKYELSRELEKLTEAKAVSIDSVNAGELERNLALKVADDLISKFFEPIPMNPSKPNQDANFQLVAYNANADKTFSYVITGQYSVTRDYCIPFDLSEINKYPNLLIDRNGN